MDLSGAGPLEASTRIQERPLRDSSEDRRQRTNRQHRDSSSSEDELPAEEEREDHQLDDLA